MSIETILAELTQALRDNTAAANLLTQSLAGRSAPAAKDAADKVVKTETKPAAKKEAEVKKEEPKPEVKEEPKDDVKEETGAVDYATVRALVLKLAPNNREGVQAINAKHGIEKLPSLLDDPKDFTTVNNQATLEAVYADLQALDV